MDKDPTSPKKSSDLIGSHSRKVKATHLKIIRIKVVTMKNNHILVVVFFRALQYKYPCHYIRLKMSKDQEALLNKPYKRNFHTIKMYFATRI